MAGFRTHLIGGALAGGLTAAGAMAEGLISWELAPLVTLVGVIGGLAPDLDSDTGRPIRVLFGGAALVAPAAVLWRLPQLAPSWAHGAIAAAVVVALVLGPVRWLFKRLTVHRGTWHSLPVAAIFGCLAFLLAGRRGAAVELQITLGVAAALGAGVHLVLDELWSVDFNGRLVKRSFGSALTPLGSSRALTVLAWSALGGLSVMVWQSLEGQRPELLFDRLLGALGG